MSSGFSRTLGTVVGGEQRFEPLVRGGILKAGAVEKNGPISIAQFERGLKKGFLVVDFKIHACSIIYQDTGGFTRKTPWNGLPRQTSANPKKSVL
jgi:hypothetical protein